MKKNLLASFLFLIAFAATAQRNVVLIIADDLGTDYLGFYEDHVDTAAMPNIRSLLSRGVRFTNAWSNPVCSATRAGMLTGRYGFRTGVGGIVGAGSGALSLDEMTIPQLLENWQPGEFAKANIGKWHLHNPVPASNLGNPNLLGYDHFEGPFIGALQDYFNWTKVTNGVSATVSNYATTETAGDAIDWVKNNSVKPFFLWLAFNAPHAPYHLPPLDLHSLDNLPGTAQHIMQNRKLYFRASVEALDTEIGRIFDSLMVHGQFDNTDFIFIGDNGNAAPTNQIPVAGHGKETIYHYGLHVPFIVAGPSVVAPGRTSDALVNTVDLFATILELFGHADWQSQIPPGKPVDSRSLLPVLKNTSTEVRPWAFSELFTSTPEPANGKTIRNRDFKLLRFDDGNEEFYHLAADPYETNNLLSGSLTDDQLANYQFLCNEMTALVGAGNFCTPSVGVEDAAESPERVSIFPNPSNGSISLKINDLKANEFFRIQMFDAKGSLVFQKEQAGARLEIDGLPQGVYFLKINFADGLVFKKVLANE